MKHICFVLTVEIAVKAFLINHLKALSEHYQLTVITRTANNEFLSALGVQAELINLPFSREVSLVADLKCLFKLMLIFWQRKVDAVHSVTPKAGLLAMLAGFVCGIPVRVHTFTGQVWASKRGVKRFALKYIDWFYGKLSTHNIVDSPSQRDFLIKECVLSPDKCLVFGKGSISGVDILRFKPDQGLRTQVRDSIGLSNNALMFLFLGRLNPDKGVLDLAQAFTAMHKQYPQAHLFFVGPDEAKMRQAIMNIEGFDEVCIKFVDYTNQPEQFMVAADVFCLPSYREGFGSVIVEAAACGTPALASRIYGITDAIVEKETGLLHEPKNIDEIAEKLAFLAENPIERKRLAGNAYKRAVSDFDSKLITHAWCNFYKVQFDQMMKAGNKKTGCSR